MTVRRAADVEGLGIAGDFAIAVGAPMHSVKACPGQAGTPAELDLFRRMRCRAESSFRSQDFLDGGLDQAGLFDQPAFLLGGKTRQRPTSPLPIRLVVASCRR